MLGVLVGFLEFWRDLDPNIRFLLTYASPEGEIAKRVLDFEQDVKNADALLDTWQAHSTQILRFYNRNRDRCVLVAADSVASNTIRLVELCNDRWGLQFQRPDCQFGQNDSRSVLVEALARTTTQERDELHELYDELEAAASLPYGESLENRFDGVWSEYRKLIETQGEMARRVSELERNNQTDKLSFQQTREKLEKDNENLLLQLHKVQEELEEREASLEEAKQRDELRLVSGSDGSQTSLLDADRHETAIKELESENELLLMQLHQVQEELEHYYELSQSNQSSSQPGSALDGRIHLGVSQIQKNANWYSIEIDDSGRQMCWSGPDPRATITFPITGDRAQIIVIQFRQTLTKTQLRGLHIEIDGVRVPHRAYAKLNPKSIEIEFTPSSQSSADGVELAIVLPKMHRPSEVNAASQDSRLLGIAVYGVSVLPLDPKLRACKPRSLRSSISQSSKLLRLGLSFDAFPLAYFDGLAYLREHPGVVAAVHDGKKSSALEHYLTVGYRKRYKFPLADRALPCLGDNYDLMRQDAIV